MVQDIDDITYKGSLAFFSIAFDGGLTSVPYFAMGLGKDITTVAWHFFYEYLNEFDFSAFTKEEFERACKRMAASILKRVCLEVLANPDANYSPADIDHVRCAYVNLQRLYLLYR